MTASKPQGPNSRTPTTMLYATVIPPGLPLMAPPARGVRPTGAPRSRAPRTLYVIRSGSARNGSAGLNTDGAQRWLGSNGISVRGADCGGSRCETGTGCTGHRRRLRTTAPRAGNRYGALILSASPFGLPETFRLTAREYPGAQPNASRSPRVAGPSCGPSRRRGGKPAPQRERQIR